MTTQEIKLKANVDVDMTDAVKVKGQLKTIQDLLYELQANQVDLFGSGIKGDALQKQLQEIKEVRKELEKLQQEYLKAEAILRNSPQERQKRIDYFKNQEEKEKEQREIESKRQKFNQRSSERTQKNSEIKSMNSRQASISGGVGKDKERIVNEEISPKKTAIDYFSPESIKNAERFSKKLNEIKEIMSLIGKYSDNIGNVFEENGVLDKTEKAIKKIEEITGKKVTESLKQQIYESFNLDALIKDLGTEIVSGGEIKTGIGYIGQRIRSSSFVTEKGEFIPSGFKAKDGTYTPNLTNFVHSSRLQSLGLNDKSLYQIGNEYDKLVAEGTEEAKKKAETILNAVIEAFENTSIESIQERIGASLYRQDFDTDNFKTNSYFYGGLRAKLSESNFTSGNFSMGLQRSGEDLKGVKELSEDEYILQDLRQAEKEEALKVKTAYTGMVSEVIKTIESLSDFISSDEFKEELLTNSDPKMLIANLLGQVGDLSISERYSTDYFDGTNNSSMQDQRDLGKLGRDEAEERGNIALSNYNKFLFKLNDIIDDLLQTSRGMQSEELIQASNLLKQKIEVLKQGEEKLDFTQIVNAFSNLLTKGKVFTDSIQKYADNTGLEYEKALRQAAEMGDQSKILEMVDSINLNKQVEEILNTSVDKFKEQIKSSNLITSKNKDLADLMKFIPDALVGGIVSGTGGETLQKLYETYKTEEKESKLGKFKVSKLKFIKIYEEFITNIGKQFTQLETPDKDSQAVISGIKNIIETDLDNFKNFSRFLEDFYSETYKIGATSINYNYEAAQQNKNAGRDRPKYSNSPSWEQRTPKERFIGGTQSLDVTAMYGANNVDEALERAQILYIEKEEELKNLLENRKKALEKVKNTEDRIKKNEEEIEQIISKYPRDSEGKVEWWRVKSDKNFQTLLPESRKDRERIQQLRVENRKISERTSYQQAKEDLVRWSNSNGESVEDSIKKEIIQINEDIQYLTELKQWLEDASKVSSTTTSQAEKVLNNTKTEIQTQKGKQSKKDEIPLFPFEYGSGQSETIIKDDNSKQISKTSSQFKQNETKSGNLTIDGQTHINLNDEVLLETEMALVKINQGDIEAKEININGTNIKGNFSNTTGKIELDRVEALPVEYHENKQQGMHYYTNKNTGDIIPSITQLRSFLTGSDPRVADGIKSINDKRKQLKDNEVLTAESMGMSDKDFKFFTQKLIGKGLRGDIFHSAVDTLAKYSTETGKDVEYLSKHFNEILKNSTKFTNDLSYGMTELAKLGLGEDFVSLQDSLESYFDMAKKSGLEFTKFSETPLAARIHTKNGKYFDVAGTADQVVNMGGYATMVDNKRDAMRGYEAFQTNLLKMLFKANYESNIPINEKGETLKQLMGKDIIFDDSMKVFVANVKDAETQLIEFSQLTEQELLELIQKAYGIMNNTGEQPFTQEEIQKRMGYSKPQGIVTGYSENYDEIHQDMFTSNREEERIIQQYLTWYKQRKQIESEITKLEYQLSKAKEEEKTSIQSRIDRNKELKNNIDEILNTEYRLSSAFLYEDLDGNKYESGLKIGDRVLTESGEDFLKRRQAVIDSQIDVKDTVIQNKNTEDTNKKALELIQLYLSEKEKLINLQKEEYDLTQKGVELDSTSLDYNKRYAEILEQINVNQDQQNRTKEILNQFSSGKNGLNIEDLTYTDNNGNIFNLSVENKQALIDAQLQIRKKQADEEARIGKLETEEKQKQLKQQESDLKSSQSRYLKLLTERHNIQLSILKLKNQNEEINATTKDQTKIQENNVLLDQYKNQLVETSQEFEELENHLRTIDALNDDAFRIENNRFNNEQVKTNNSHSENLRKIESNNSKNQEKINDAQVKSYLNNLREQYKLERDIAIQQEHLKSVDGGQKKEVQAYIDILTRQRDALKASAPIYDQVNKTLNGQKLTTEQLITLEQGRTKEINNQEIQMAKIQANIRAQIPLLDQLIGSFKVAFQNVSLYNVSQKGFNAIENAIRQVISSAKELDASLVDIQIASGMTKKETNQFMISLNQLGQELGMTTQEMASASNDWLRAGYQGREAMELTRASASLAQLGMIDTADATSYLISSLKGWKLEASEVMNVVSKLTAVDMSAAISAGDLAEAMSRANSSAQLAGVSMDRYIGLLTVGADVTQRAPESIGQAWNTLFARLGNVKAGKFVASQEEMESDNYNADDFEALNDVEKVLDSVGIKLRENYGIWRDTEDVIDSIAKQWDNWDKTTQNAVATSVAGTRQREIFVTTMENYDQVSKYEQIAANSYGTAQEKMLAYTDSLEASQKRYQNALESFSLALNRTEILKMFYDTITFITKNFVGLGTAITTIIALTKGQDIAKFFTEGISSVGMRTVNFGQNLFRIKTDVDNQGLWTTFKGMFSDISSNLNQAYNEQLKERYATDLRKNYNTLTESQQNSMIGNQNAFLFNENGIDLNVVQNALKDFTNALQSENILDLNDEINNLKDAISYYQSQLEESEGLGEDITSPLEETLSDLQSQLGERQTVLEQQRQQALMEVATNEEYVGIKDQLISEHRQEYDALVQQYLTDVDENGQTRSLAEAERLATSQILESNLTEEELQRITRQLTTRRGELTAGQNMALGAITSGLGLVGTIGVGNFGQQFFGDNGQIVGSMVGGMLTTTAMSSISSAINNPEFRNSIVTAFKSGSLKGVLSGVSGALGSAGLWGAGIALIGTLVLAGVGLWKKHQKELIEAQAKEFQEESNKYQSMLSASIDASKFDKLSTGVDRLGRNVSLTDDEYEEFLNLNTKLAEQFPGLIKFTDGQGQAFIGAADGANSLSESIDSLIKQQKKLANEKLLAPELFGQTYKDAKKQYDEANKEYQNELKNSQYNLNDYSVSNKTNTEWLWGTDNLYGWHNRDYVQYIGGNEEINKQILKLAKSKGADSIKEINDQVLSDDGYSFNNVLIGIKVNPKDEAILKQSIEEIIGDSKSKLVELENNFEQSKHILDSEIQAIFENLSFNDTAFDINPEFDVEKFNKLSDEAKNVLRNAISGMQLTAKDGESFKFQVSDIIQQLIGQLDENDYNLIYEVGFEYDGESTYKEFIEARKQLYNIIQSLDIDDEIKKKILLSLEFTIDDTGNYSDNFDYVKRIRDEGLSKNFNFTDWYDTLSNNYSPDELKEIYSYLREINDLGIQISKQNLWDKFVVSKYTLSSTKELLNYFNQLENTTDALGQKRLNIVTDRIKELGKELGLTSENLDYLNRAFNRMPEIDNLGIVTETPEKVSENFEDYSKIREYLNNDFNGTWDTDMLNLVMSKEDLAPFIGDINQLKKEVNSIPKEYEISYKRAIANAMGVSEAGYQSLLNMHSDLVKKMNDNYGVDLTQYKNLEQAKAAVNAKGLILQQNAWKDYISNLSIMYGKDLEAFGKNQQKKIEMLGVVAANMGLAESPEEGEKLVMQEAAKKGGYTPPTASDILQITSNLSPSEALQYYLGKGDIREQEKDKANAAFEKGLNEVQNEYMKKYSEQQVNDAKKQIEDLMKDITIADIPIGNLGDSDNSGSGSGNKFKEQLQNALDILKNYRNLIDKEWEAMLAWDEDKQVDYGTKYFEKMRENLSGQINATQTMIDELNSKGIKTDSSGNKTYWDIDSGEQITQKEFMSQINTYEADLIELQKELNNLDDEELQDNISLAEKKKEILDFEDERLGVYENYNRYLSKSEQSYRRQKENLEQQLWLAKELLKNTTDTEEEYYTNLQKVEELERKIADLEYEQQEHRISILESVDASVYALIDAQNILISQARTQEELISAQNTLNDLLKQERDLRKSIFEFQQQNAERSNQYLSSTAYSNSDRYDNNYNLQVQSLESMKNITLENMEAEFRKAYKQYITELDEVTGQRKWTDEEAYTMAGQTEDYMSAYNEWFDLTQQIADLAVQKMEDKLAELDDMLDRAERVKPDDWSYYEQISEYTNEQLDILQKKKELLEDSLKDVSSWTDEQIKQATDNLNDTVEAINEALKNQKQEQIDYQDRQFDALISYLERMREEYNNLRDDVEEYYDTLLKPLEQEIEGLDKINELLELQENLRKSQEKSRVYRQGEPLPCIKID